MPVIVIEVLSPSNTEAEMLAREDICLRFGGQEFWLVDPQRQTVKVIRAGGSSSIHHEASLIESDALGGSIRLGNIFS